MFKPSKKTDEQLWASFGKGRQASFKALYLRYREALVSYSYTICRDVSIAQDMVQDVFFQLMEKGGELSAVDNVRAYLYTCVRTRTYNQLKQSLTIVAMDGSQLDASVIAIDHILIAEELKKEMLVMLREAILALPDRQKEVLTLKYYHGFSNPEIAEIVTIKYQTVSNILHMALNNLRNKSKLRVHKMGGGAGQDAKKAVE